MSGAAAESLLPGNEPVAAPAAASGRASSVRCAFCECVLAADGGVLRTSDRVKELNRQEARIDQLRTDMAAVQRELDAAKAALAEAQAALNGRKAAADDWDS